MGTVLPFVASIVIGTIQLGSTVDYAILMTNKYKDARMSGMGRRAVYHRIGQFQSIIVSALSFFAATVGVGFFSHIDMISALCTLLARGAIISMFVVILFLPAVLWVFDPIVIRTTIGFRGIRKGKETERQGETL